jgi:hypothetical protein
MNNFVTFSLLLVSVAGEKIKRLACFACTRIKGIKQCVEQVSNISEVVFLGSQSIMVLRDTSPSEGYYGTLLSSSREFVTAAKR